MDLSKKTRLNLLNKIAKKADAPLRGKHSKKDLASIKDKKVKQFNTSMKMAEDKKKQLAAIMKSIEDNENVCTNLQGDIVKCHEVLRVMDLCGADEVNFGKSGETYKKDKKTINLEDIAYLNDNDNVGTIGRGSPENGEEGTEKDDPRIPVEPGEATPMPVRRNTGDGALPVNPNIPDELFDGNVGER